MKLIDKKSVEKYVILSRQFIDKAITGADFENMFIKTRREDKYWLEGRFDKDIGKILDVLFLDVSDYVPDELYDIDDPININENELNNRVREALVKLEKLIL
ncbi:hypothetical protein A0256_09610 [Mucilaginibacter sp. PAMC 26640]|nr:hypothetical protein A0256_09610 [Mucilaginibacter sp. PAMC 26640]